MPGISVSKICVPFGGGGINWSSYCTPRTVTVSSVADTSTTLSWDACTGATSYKIYYGTDGVTFGSSTTSATNSKKVTGLTVGQRYYFYVTALKDAEENLPSNIVDNGVVYVNNFADLTGLGIVETAGTVTVEDPMGTVVLPQKALTLTNTSAGNCYASIDLGTGHNELYVQFYVSCIKQAGATGYKDTLQIGSAVNGSEACEIKLNQAAANYAIYGLPNNQALISYVRPATIYRIGMHINLTTLTCDYYLNGVLSGQKAINNQALRYITIGGNNVSGYLLQVSALTVNEDMFMEGVASTYDVGLYTTFFVDSSTDVGIDTSAWSGAQITPYDPDGGTNYIDGPVRYSSVWSDGNYRKLGDKVLFKRGLKYKLIALNKPNGMFSLTGTALSTFTASAYGTGALPILDSSIIVDTWTEYDAVNHIYSKAIANLAQLGGVWIDETMGLCQGANLAALSTLSGHYYSDGSTLYIRLWDDGDPAAHTIDVASNQPFRGVPYQNVSYLHLRFCGILSGEYSVVHHCEFTRGAGLSISSYAHGRDNYLHDIWGGDQYDPARGRSGSRYGITLMPHAACYRNKIEDAYIGIYNQYLNENVLIAFNEIKNCIVTALEHAGTAFTGTMTFSNAIKIINNTIFASPRHLDNDPYPIAEGQPGHAISMQSSTGHAKFIILNNLILCHLNYEGIPIAAGGGLSGMHLIGAPDNGYIDYNKYYKSANCGTLVHLFETSSVLATHIGQLETNGWQGIDGGDIEEHSSVETTLPVAQADTAVDSGKFLTTDGTPVVTGDGYVFDFSPWGITEDLSGNPLGATRNIGAY